MATLGFLLLTMGCFYAWRAFPLAVLDGFIDLLTGCKQYHFQRAEHARWLPWRCLVAAKSGWWPPFLAEEFWKEAKSTSSACANPTWSTLGRSCSCIGIPRQPPLSVYAAFFPMVPTRLFCPLPALESDGHSVAPSFQTNYVSLPRSLELRIL